MITQGYDLQDRFHIPGDATAGFPRRAQLVWETLFAIPHGRLALLWGTRCQIQDLPPIVWTTRRVALLAAIVQKLEMN
jgi:hypothetical protein